MICWNSGYFCEFIGVEKAINMLNSEYEVCVFLNVETQIVWAELCVGEVESFYSDKFNKRVCSNTIEQGIFTEEALIKKMSAIMWNYVKGYIPLYY